MPNEASGDLEPKRIARSSQQTGASRSEPPRLGAAARSGRTARGARTAQARSSQDVSFPQRVTVKVSYVRHLTPQKGRDSLRRHIAYLQRESACREPGTGTFFNRDTTDIDAKNHTREWRSDHHHFRVILSPENGDGIDDFAAYARSVMARVEQDLGKLDWLAVTHKNTEHPHGHILLRGVREDGADLVIPPEYIAHGFRARAAEVATELLGVRTLDEARIALAREASAERYTSLDRTIERFAKSQENDLRLDLAKLRLSNRGVTTAEMLLERLRTLESMGLAKRGVRSRTAGLSRSRVWTIETDFGPKLRELGVRNDIIKQLHRAVGNRAHAAAAIEAPAARSNPRPARGLLLSVTAVNEQSDERLVILEDSRGRPRYARVWATRALDAVQVGGVVEIGRSTYRRVRDAEELIAVASTSASTYTTAAHRRWLREHRKQLRPDQVERRLRRFARTAKRLANAPNSGVVRHEKRSAHIDATRFRSHMEKRARHLDVRVLAFHGLESQVSAAAYTWLDRQLIRSALSESLSPSDITHHPRVQTALAQRASWLVEHGYAKRERIGDRHALRFAFGAIEKLRALELKNFSNSGKVPGNKPLLKMTAGSTLIGRFAATAHLHQGTFALVATKDHWFAAPVSRPLRLDVGERVRANVVTSRHTSFERLGRGRSIGAERE